MSKVFVFLGISLDGYIAGPNNTLENMGGDGWMDLTNGISGSACSGKNLKLGEGGETGPENQFLESILARTGVSIMGKPALSVVLSPSQFSSCFFHLLEELGLDRPA